MSKYIIFCLLLFVSCNKTTIILSSDLEKTKQLCESNQGIDRVYLGYLDDKVEPGFKIVCANKTYSSKGEISKVFLTLSEIMQCEKACETNKGLKNIEATLECNKIEYYGRSSICVEDIVEFVCNCKNNMKQENKSVVRRNDNK